MRGAVRDAPWTRAWDQIDRGFDDHLEEIRRFLRCPTVSASDDDMHAGAEFVAALIEGAGGTAEIIPTAGHPAVLGHIEGEGHAYPELLARESLMVQGDRRDRSEGQGRQPACC